MVTSVQPASTATLATKHTPSCGNCTTDSWKNSRLRQPLDYQESLYWKGQTSQAAECQPARADSISGHISRGQNQNCAAPGSGIMAQTAAGAVGYGEAMGCFAAMTTRTAA